MNHADPLERFILAPKPDWCKAEDVILVCYFMTIADESGVCSPMQDDIARFTGTNYRSMRSALDRLHQHSWITWHKAGIGQAHTYQVHFENLPRKEDTHV